MQPDRRIKVQELAEPRRDGEDLGLRGLDQRLPVGQHGRGPVGVGDPALAEPGVIGGDLGDDPRLVARLDLRRPAALGPQQLAVGRGDLEEHLVADRDRLEFTLLHGLLDAR